MKLKRRRNYLILRYFYEIKGNINNPAPQQLIPLCYRTLFLNKGIYLPLNLRTQKVLEAHQLSKHFIKPAFSYRLLGISILTY